MEHTARVLVLASLFVSATPLLALDVWIEVVAECLCGQSKGILTAYPSGGQGPYTFLWSTGATTPTIENLAPGSYSVTVTDANLDQATAEEQLIGTASFGDWGGILPLDVHGFGYCAGSPMFGKPNLESPMLSNYAHYGPFTYAGGSMVPYMMQGACGTYGPVIDFMGPVGESVSIPFEDASGCPGTMDAFIPIPWPGEQLPLEVLSVTGSCSNMANGTVLLAFGSIMDLYYGACQEAQVRLKVSGGNYYPNNCMSYSLSCSGGSRMITGLAPGTYEVHVLPYSWGITSPDRLDCGPSLEFTVPSLGTDCGLVTGRAFMDYNLNCTRQTNEPYVPGGIVEVLPGPVYTVTDAQGLYSLALPAGSYTLQQQSDLLGEHCTGGPIPFTISFGQTSTVNLPDTSSVLLDVQAMLSSGAARPGFQFNYGITVRNLTPAASGATSLTFTFDPTITYVSATPNPSSVNGNTITWNQSQLTAFQQRNYTVRFQVPPDVGLMGYELVATANVTTANTDGNPANNSATNLRTITGAYDPNDKLATTSLGSNTSWLLDEDEWIDYTIRFQNTGTDTAFNVVITDTLPANLDPGSIDIGASSHTFTWELRGQGTLKFMFPNILLPDSNVNEPRSHGFVSFRIRPQEGLAVGQQITNIANIYFDFNPPVITEPSVLNVVSPIRLDVRAWLGGAYDEQTTLMRDDLRSQALLPLTEPYTTLGYTHSGDGGGESISPSLLTTTGPTAIVDWVVLELRSATTPSTVLHSRSALLRRDGRITDKDSISPVAFNAPVGNYRIALRHRNHLGVISAAPIALGSSATTWDIRTTATALFGTTPTSLSGSNRLLWPGDVNFNGQAKYTGTNNDRDLILQAVGGTTPTNVLNSVYSGADVNMDGQVKYTGTVNDRDLILQTIGGTVPTAVRTQQVP